MVMRRSPRRVPDSCEHAYGRQQRGHAPDAPRRLARRVVRAHTFTPSALSLSMHSLAQSSAHCAVDILPRANCASPIATKLHTASRATCSTLSALSSYSQQAAWRAGMRLPRLAHHTVVSSPITHVPHVLPPMLAALSVFLHGLEVVDWAQPVEHFDCRFERIHDLPRRLVCVGRLVYGSLAYR